MPAPGQNSLVGVTNLGAQASLYELFFDQYTGAGGSGAPIYPSAKAYNANGYAAGDGYGGLLYWDLWENNVAGSGAIIIEGTDLAGVTPGSAYAGSAFSGAIWVPVGYYAIVANGVTATTLTRAQGAVTLTQNTLTRLQILDAYAYMRARVTSNVSSASLSALLYGIAN